MRQRAFTAGLDSRQVQRISIPNTPGRINLADPPPPPRSSVYGERPCWAKHRHVVLLRTGRRLGGK